MHGRKIILISVLVIVIVVSLAFAWPSIRAWTAFTGTIAITFTERGFGEPDKSIVITDVKEVQRLLGTIRLSRKQTCDCSHIQNVIFQKSKKQVEVSFCDHCFDILGPKRNGWYSKVREYSMPNEFYAEFRRLVLSRTNEHWHVTQ